MSLWQYAHCGLTVATELPVPELCPLDARLGDEPDVRVTLEHEAPPAGDRSELSAPLDEFRFSAPGAGDFVVREGREILIAPYPLVEHAMLRLYLLGSAWGALLYQRGAFPLHAGVVATDAGAFAFCGPPAAGKSSTVTWLVQRGHSLVSDDLARLEVPVDGPPQIWPSTPRLKLSRETLAFAGWPMPRSRPALPDDKFHLRWTGAMPDGPLPLRAVYVLSWGEPGLRRLRGGDALRRFLAAATYRRKLLDAPGEPARYWRLCVEIVRRVPIWELSRRRDWASMDQVMEQLSLGPSLADR